MRANSPSIGFSGHVRLRRGLWYACILEETRCGMVNVSFTWARDRETAVRWICDALPSS